MINYVIPLTSTNTTYQDAHAALSHANLASAGNQNKLLFLTGNALSWITFSNANIAEMITVADFASLPASGDAARLYWTADNNRFYRWTGSAYYYIDQEVMDAIDLLQDALDGEIADREADVSLLTTNLNTEITNRTNADSTLQTNINTEASTRASADTTLQNNINTEASTRASADTTLQNNIDAEATARTNADALKVPYTGATGNADLGSYSWTATSYIASAAGYVLSNVIRNSLGQPYMSFITGTSLVNFHYSVALLTGCNLTVPGSITTTGGILTDTYKGGGGSTLFSWNSGSGYIDCSQHVNMATKDIANAGTLTCATTIASTNLDAPVISYAGNNLLLSGTATTCDKPFYFKSYTTAGRPATVEAMMIYDTTLHLPIFYNGTVWKDFANNTV